jgi:O-antigen/teichoic acid export membrane protein
MITMIDRVFITNMVGIDETGIYTVGYQVGMIVGVVSLSINKAWTPWLYEKLNDGSESAKKKIIKLTYIIFVAIICFSLVLSVLAPWFMKYLVGENFDNATGYIIWIAFGYTFNGMYFMVAGYIFYEEKTHLLSWMTFMAAGLNMILNYFFILKYGAIGAAYATGLTYFFHFLLTWYLASRVYKMPWFSFK